jgi:Na+(H+)/acetate symporter ActP
VAGSIATLAWRRSRSVAKKAGVTATWWKFLVVGPCLAALVILASGVGVEAWYLGMVVVLAAFVSTATGLALGVAHLFTHRVRGNPT